MKISVNVTNKDLNYLLITAIEGGFTTIWAELQDRSYSPSKGRATLRKSGKKGAPWIKITRATIARGLTRTANAKPNEGGWAFAEWLKDRAGDRIVADVILQFGMFGEIRYE